MAEFECIVIEQIVKTQKELIMLWKCLECRPYKQKEVQRILNIVTEWRKEFEKDYKEINSK